MVVSKGKFYMDSIRVVLKDLIDAEEILIKNGVMNKSRAQLFLRLMMSLHLEMNW
jgi:hypothetical protein